MMFAGTLLLCAAFVLAWLNIQEDRRAGEASRAVVMQIRQTMAQPAAAAPELPEVSATAEPTAAATAQLEAAVTAELTAAATEQLEASVTAEPTAAATMQPEASVTAEPTAIATEQPEVSATAQPDAQRITLTSALFNLLKRLPEALMGLLSGVQPVPQPTLAPVMPTYAPPALDELAVLDVEPDFIRDPDMEMPVTEVDGHAYIGVLDIPRLERSLPVMSMWSYPKLKIAPCLYTGSIYSHDAVFSAHNYEEHLRYLWQLEPGDEVRFTDVSGNVFIYEVILQEILAPYEVERMTTRTDWDLTLFTCKTGGRMRITTRCALKSYIAATAVQNEE